jgi:homoserine O-acetyltransferase/O-succinyltransferase
MNSIRDTFAPSRRDVLRFLSSAAVGVPIASSAAIADQGESQLPQEGVFELGDLRLESGVTLPNAKLGYKTHGRLNAARSNVILYPTSFAAQHGDIEWLIGPGKALDPDKSFIIVLDQLGNGLSSSPNNTPSPLDRMRFPTITIRDDVAAHHRLVTSGFGIRRVALVTGWSMGAQQTFQWAASHPDMVERIAPFCGTAKTTPHNAVFLQGVRAALTADAAWMDGNYQDQPAKGVRAFSHVYAGWAFSQPFYKQELYRQLGFGSLEDFITGFWERRYVRRDANNLLSMLRTWQLNDLGATPGFGGSLERALGAIKAKATVMAGETDLYFTPADIEADAAYIPGARFRVIPSVWGHMAGAGLNPADSEFIDKEIKALLAT